jgi:transcriptional regulator with XRE-family HTH domain
MFLPSIDLNVSEKLKRDPEFRQRFFVAESSAEIAHQLIALRKRRGLSQAQLAEKLGTQQPAISRVESADYRNWSYNTLRKEAEVLDARLRVLIQAAEDVLIEYETEAGEQPINKEFVTVITNKMAAEQPVHQRLYVNPWQANQGITGIVGFPTVAPPAGVSFSQTIASNVGYSSIYGPTSEIFALRQQLAEKDKEIASLRASNNAANEPVHSVFDPVRTREQMLPFLRLTQEQRIGAS